MESFKGMGAKMRFRAAMDKGIMREARIAAALMLQGAWRAKEARRKMVAKRAEKENLKMEVGGWVGGCVICFMSFSYVKVCTVHSERNSSPLAGRCIAC